MEEETKETKGKRQKTLVARVMEQVEALKFWALRYQKTGFEQDYEAALAAVAELKESPEKQHMLADVLLRGAWWLPGKASDALYAEIRAAALDGRNEDVMQSVLSRAHDRARGEEKLRVIREQIAEMEKAGFVKTLGYLWFWLGVTLRDMGRADEAAAAFGRVTELLTPTDVYWANARAALWAEARSQAAGGVQLAATGEALRRIGGAWHFWSQPGYSRDAWYGRDVETAVFYRLSRCDGLLFDETMQPGETRVSADGRVTLTLRAAGGTVTVPAGAYADCLVFETKGETYQAVDVETVLAPGVGIVRQTDRRAGVRWVLTSAAVQGGGRLPLAVGNRWEYHAEELEPGVLYRDEQWYEVVGASNDTAVLSHAMTAAEAYDTTVWRGCMLAARRGYCHKEADGREHLRDVMPLLADAARLAGTKRERIHTAVASSVMRRILAGDPETSPGGTERGRWDFFTILTPTRTDGVTRLPEEERLFSFEWKEWQGGFAMYAVGCNFLWEMIDGDADGVWRDAWVPGYAAPIDHTQYGRRITGTLAVGEDEAVTTPAGAFASCRHVTLDAAGGIGYWCGHLELWYAPGVGLVQFTRTVTECGEPRGALWQLTEYEGAGEGYFPLADGMRRRYEAIGLPDGWRGAVTYTVLEDDAGMAVFKDALGTQRRA